MSGPNEKPDVLLLGGSGALGTALLHELAQHEVNVSFTYHRQQEHALALQQELGFAAFPVDLCQPHGVPELFAQLAQAGREPDVVIHCAGHAPSTALADITLQEWDRLQALHGRAACNARSRWRCGWTNE